MFAPFKTGSAYFPQEQPVMLNFRVKDIDGLLAELKGEGNKIELWEEA